MHKHCHPTHFGVGLGFRYFFWVAIFKLIPFLLCVVACVRRRPRNDQKERPPEPFTGDGAAAESSSSPPEHPPLTCGGQAADATAVAASAAAAAEGGDMIGGSGAGHGPAVRAAGHHQAVQPVRGAVWTRFFFDSLWPARGKWAGLPVSPATRGAPAPEASNSAGDSTRGGAAPSDFKVTVCVRFRPLAEGEAAQDSKLGLPLHQFIKLKRQQVGTS